MISGGSGVMVKTQLVRRGIRDERVLEAFRAVPRDRFVREEDLSRAYDDEPLKIGHGQTISQPYIVALTCEALCLSAEDRVLEIGTGSGYEAAILSLLCREVVSVERIEELGRTASDRMKAMGFDHVRVVTGDGSAGVPEYAPYDAIAVAAAAPDLPAPLLEQLDAGGRIVIPIGNRSVQELFLFCRRPGGKSFGRPIDHPERFDASGSWARIEKLCDCRFVPLVGSHGFGPSLS